MESKISIKRRLCKFFMDINSYISGYVDGEGCFCVSFQPSRRHSLGWEARPSFSVSQNAERSALLYYIRDLWKCGTIRPDRSDKTLKYEVRAITELNAVIVPHFRAYPLFSEKQRDFELFAQACNLLSQNIHLTRGGFRDLVKVAFEMNPSGKRKYSESEILSSLCADEGIVCAASNCR